MTRSVEAWGGRYGQVLVCAALMPIPCMSQTVVTTVAPARRTAIVSIPDRKLAVIEDGAIVAIFRVAVGAPASPSPTGEFQIVNRVSNPTYYHPGSVIPGGKDNPVGTRWLGLSQRGYGIHGTNVPSSVGHAASHGCIRLRNRDVERLFSMLRVRDTVQIHGERDPEVAQIFGSSENTVLAATGISAESGASRKAAFECDLQAG